MLVTNSVTKRSLLTYSACSPRSRARCPTACSRCVFPSPGGEYRKTGLYRSPGCSAADFAAATASSFDAPTVNRPKTYRGSSGSCAAPDPTTIGAASARSAVSSGSSACEGAAEAVVTSNRTSSGSRDTRSIARCTTPFIRLPRYSAAKALGAPTTRQSSAMAIPTVCLRKVS